MTKDVRLCSHRPVLWCPQGRSRVADQTRANAHSERVGEETAVGGPREGGSKQTHKGCVTQPSMSCTWDFRSLAGKIQRR